MRSEPAERVALEPAVLRRDSTRSVLQAAGSVFADANCPDPARTVARIQG